MRWPFEQRAGRRYPTTEEATTSTTSTNATDATIAELLAQASGKAVDATTLAVVESCAGLWERCLASATVEPLSNRTAGLTPALLALVGRALAVKGNLVCRITVEGAAVRLWPAADFDIQGETDPATWTYRLNLPGPSATYTVMAPADGVVHFRCGALPSAPWRGVAPLARATSTATLAAAAESSLSAELKIPPGRVGLVHGKAADLLAWMRTGGFFAGGNVADRGLQQEPAARHKPATYGPEPTEVMAALRSDTGRDIANAFGVSPALFAERGDGAGQREAWRRFWLGTVQPLAVQIQAEVREKLAPGVSITLEGMRAGDEDGRSRAVMRRASAFKTLVDTGMDRDEARRLAGLGV